VESELQSQTFLGGVGAGVTNMRDPGVGVGAGVQKLTGLGVGSRKFDRSWSRNQRKFTTYPFYWWSKGRASKLKKFEMYLCLDTHISQTIKDSQ